jgi:hypothetical protein
MRLTVLSLPLQLDFPCIAYDKDYVIFFQNLSLELAKSKTYSLTVFDILYFVLQSTV